MTVAFANLALFVMASLDEFPKAGAPAPTVGRVGTVYPIAEMDALAEIEARADRVKFDPEQFGDSDGWGATQSHLLPLATEDAERTFLPLHTTDFEITDQSGDVLYPSQYTFNPLQYATLPGRIIVVPDDRVDWALAEATPMDMVLLSGGNALTEMDRTGKSIFAISPIIAERLGVERIPVIVTQEGAQLVLREFDAARIPIDEHERTGVQRAAGAEAVASAPRQASASTETSGETALDNVVPLRRDAPRGAR